MKYRQKNSRKILFNHNFHTSDHVTYAYIILSHTCIQPYTTIPNWDVCVCLYIFGTHVVYKASFVWPNQNTPLDLEPPSSPLRFSKTKVFLLIDSTRAT